MEKTPEFEVEHRQVGYRRLAKQAGMRLVRKRVGFPRMTVELERVRPAPVETAVCWMAAAANRWMQRSPVAGGRRRSRR